MTHILFHGNCLSSNQYKINSHSSDRDLPAHQARQQVTSGAELFDLGGEEIREPLEWVHLSLLTNGEAIGTGGLAVQLQGLG